MPTTDSHLTTIGPVIAKRYIRTGQVCSSFLSTHNHPTMATDLITNAAQLSLETSYPYHPLNPLNGHEISAAVTAIKQHLGGRHKNGRIWFKAIQLIEPPKAQLAPWLDEWHAAPNPAARDALKPLSRRAEASVGMKHADGTNWYGE
jgi:Cu2+-containing amine oxidase